MMSGKMNLKTNKTIRPVIYCFTTPNDISHTGYCKIGYTDKMTADECIYQESRRTDTMCVKAWESLAMFDSGCYEPFTDHDFHDYLTALGIERKKSVYAGRRKPEYFKIEPEQAKHLLMRFKEMTHPDDVKKEYILREEQQAAVDLATNYMATTTNKEILLNAKPRFGKTLTVYDYCKQHNAKNILVVTNRPVIATSWYSDFVKFLGPDEYAFVSNCDAVKNMPYCTSRDKYERMIATNGDKTTRKCIEFLSLQDLKGSKWFGGRFDKLRHVADTLWDVLIVDESHEGVDTFKTHIAFNRIHRKETFYLSGTPFKQIASDKFPKEAIFNWTYAEEQEKKANWDYSIDSVNPYEDLPQLNLFTYRLSDMFVDNDRLNEDIQRDRYFNLNEFFKTNDSGAFENGAEIDIFLNTITSVGKYPLANEETRSQIKHSLWLLDRVDSAKALAKKLKNHPKFTDYQIVVAAGDGKIEDDEKVDDSFNKVIEAIKKYDKTITLSVGQLTTGVTIPEWSAVFMLCNITSPSLYIQASFRAQNPCLIKDDNGFFTRKENAYIFDFDPARTLDIMERFANDLYSDTTMGRGDANQRAANIEKLIKYFPIVGENDSGELVDYTPEDVITIPSKIQSKEIVKHGFMCNFLFQNVGKLFNDTRAMNILSEVKEVKGTHQAPPASTISYDENGNTAIDEEKAEQKANEVVLTVQEETSENRGKAASNYYDNMSTKESFLDTVKNTKNQKTREQQEQSDLAAKKYAKERAEDLKTAISETLLRTYGNGLFNTKKIENDIVEKFTEKVMEMKKDYDMDMEELRVKHEEEKKNLTDGSSIKELIIKYADTRGDKEFEFACALEGLENTFVHEVVHNAIKEAETKNQEKANKKAENDFAFPKLKAFARSIPSFLMAYGDKNTTCDQFGKIIKPETFKEMTGIELSDYMYFIEQQYFNEITFNNAIKEFFSVKERLANYFDENSTEDIFDYIPPQKTNQIFTPKNVVKQMVDLLEENNPSCFNQEDKTFIDIYMKSGLFIAEVVKRLYRSEKLKTLFPDDEKRLKHIFEHQVYGLAPTEIIYRIATNFIFGSELTKGINTNHFIMLDAQPYAENGTLEQKLDEIFGQV